MRDFIPYGSVRRRDGCRRRLLILRAGRTALGLRTFRIGGSTKSASTVETMQAIRTEIDKMRTAEVTPVELKEAKESVLNSFVFFFDSPEKTLNRVMRYAYFGYPKDFLFQYQKAIESVTRADVLRVMKEHVKPEELVIVAVGNPKEMPKPLSSREQCCTNVLIFHLAA